MRATLTTLAFAGALGLFCYQSAGAIPTDAAVMKRAATAASEVQDAQFYARPTASSSAIGNSSWGVLSVATSIGGGGKTAL